MTDDYLALQEEANHLAQQLFGNDSKKCASFTNRLLDIYTRAQGKDFLLIHNPGGFGNRDLEHCLQWERSAVTGICATIEKLGYTWLLIQHFRAARGWLPLIGNIKQELFRLSALRTNILATQLEFIIRHIDTLKVIMIGISQGAAFSNAVMQHLTEPGRVYSIELGMIFTHKSRRVIDERTLALDSNGTMPDPTCQRDMKRIIKAYTTAPFLWSKYRLQGRPVEFAYCVNTPGHNYDWSYPEVRRQIENFLETNFGSNTT